MPAGVRELLWLLHLSSRFAGDFELTESPKC